jgi:hypothetical protein
MTFWSATVGFTPPSWIDSRRNVRILIGCRLLGVTLKGLSVGALIAVALLLESDSIGAAQG